MLMELKIMEVDPDLIWDVPSDLHPLVELLHPSHQKVALWTLEQDTEDKPLQVQELLNGKSHKIFEPQMDPEIMDQMDLVELVIPWIPER